MSNIKIETHGQHNKFFIDDYLYLFSSVRKGSKTMVFEEYRGGDFLEFISESNGLTTDEYLRYVNLYDPLRFDKFYSKISKWEFRALASIISMEFDFKGSASDILRESLRKFPSYYVTGKFTKEFGTRLGIDNIRVMANGDHYISLWCNGDVKELQSRRKLFNFAKFIGGHPSGWGKDRTVLTSMGVTTSWLLGDSRVARNIQRRDDARIAQAIFGFQDIFGKRVVYRGSWPYKPGLRSKEVSVTLYDCMGRVVKVPGISQGTYAHYCMFLVLMTQTGRFNDPFLAFYNALRFKGEELSFAIFRLIHNLSFDPKNGLFTAMRSIKGRHIDFATNFVKSWSKATVPNKEAVGLGILNYLKNNWARVEDLLYTVYGVDFEKGKVKKPGKRANINSLLRMINALTSGEEVKVDTSREKENRLSSPSGLNSFV